MQRKSSLSSDSECVLGRNAKNFFEVDLSPLGKSGDQRRTFTKYQKDELLYQQDGRCASARCNHKKLDPKVMQFEHKKPWASGGRTIFQYGRVLCSECYSIPSIKEKVRKRKQKKSVSFF